MDGTYSRGDSSTYRRRMSRGDFGRVGDEVGIQVADVPGRGEELSFGGCYAC